MPVPSESPAVLKTNVETNVDMDVDAETATIENGDRNENENEPTQMQQTEREREGTTKRETAAATGMLYKGKALRSWPQLPPEVIRLIATYHLYAATTAALLPAAWAFRVPRGTLLAPMYTLLLGAHHSPDDEADLDKIADDTRDREKDRERERESERERERERAELAQRPWEARMLYVAVRDTRTLERFMRVCPQWGLAVEHHAFWRAALAVLDPHDACAQYGWVQPPAPPPPPPQSHSNSNTHLNSNSNSNSNSNANSHSNSNAHAHAPPPLRLSPYAHFRAVLHHACLPCRLAAPRTSAGLGAAYRSTAAAFPSPPTSSALVDAGPGPLALCREHHAARTTWCGVCLRDAPRARRAAREGVRAAQEELARAEGRLRGARWEDAAGGAADAKAAVDRATEARQRASDALGRALAAEAGACGAGPWEGGGREAREGREGAGAGEGVAENEDERAFGGAVATCRACRSEGLWRAAVALAAEVAGPPGGEGEAKSAWDGGAELLGALGGRDAAGRWAPPDPFVRAAVGAFVELGEGTVARVLDVARECGWLRVRTRWTELIGQALAARRFNAEAGGAGAGTDIHGGVGHAFANSAANVAAYARAGYTTSTGADADFEFASGEEEEEYDSEEYEDEDESEAERGAAARRAEEAVEASVRELALGDWARGRILDGAWVAPADLYYGVRVGGLDGPDNPVAAVHPVAWAISAPPSPAQPPADADFDAEAGLEERTHPGPRSSTPPTYALAEAAHNAHTRQMRAVLLPALHNLVRRAVVECALDAEDGGGQRDPAVRIARMGLEDVVRALREEEGLWFDGVDWRERRRNARAEAAEAEAARGLSARSDGSSEGTARTSAGTSPGLSVSTRGTTPSPPPPGEGEADAQEKGEERAREREREREREQDRPPAIPVMPVLDPPRLLRAIPYVPETIAHLPPYSMDTLRYVWREACAPLYHCRCSICERAAAIAQAALGPETAVHQQVQPQPPPQQPHAPHEPPVESERDAADAYWRQAVQDGPGARELALVAAEMDFDDYSDVECGPDDGAGKEAFALAPSAWVEGRKRSVDELEGDGEGGAGAGAESAADAHGDAPAKRARTGARGVGA
ncbi:hypothetical protein B0H15DRAFT_1024922 [Mycena belliarum]|uniref:Uncharacterized protein n=1 Tax=Mycena belliarum TaxID=1033014 RepID=A0AAD6XIH3_9AGAR|nr:hypothetical protein B0H15DRAFT_1024922 [Mycena belliae]